MLKNFVATTRGAVAPVFAISLIPMLGAAGAAIDFARAYQERTVVQDALDAAALAGGRKVGGATTDQIKAEINKYYYDNVGEKIVNPPALDMQVSGGTVTVTTTLHVPTTILRILNMDEIVFNMKTQAKAGMGTLEVALVLDNSTSMAGSKISTLKTAATDLTNKLYALQSTSTQPDPVKMAVVPFAASVKVGSQYSNASWVDTGNSSSYNADSLKSSSLLGAANVAPSTTNNLALFAGLKDSSGNPITWAGCFQERPAPYDVSDDPATPGTPSSMFVPMFAPDEPDNWTCNTSNCPYAGTSSSTYRYNGTRSGSQSYNNYLPDAGDPTTCPSEFNTFTVTKANPGVFTKNGHGLTAGTPIVLSTTGSLYGGLNTGEPYYVFPAGITANTFMVSSTTSRTNVTASSSTFTKNNHGLSAGTALQFQSTGSLPSPLNSTTTYYVMSSNLNSNSFRISTTPGGGGSAISVSGGSGTLSYLPAVSTNSGSQSGTHYYNKAVNWTCSNGNANCDGANVGKSEESGFGGANVSTAKMCKYGTAANKATVANLTVSSFAGGPNYMCTTTAITPLTTTQNTVTSAINALAANGYTNIASGVAWGMRVLSSGEPFTEGRPTTDKNNLKVMIVMTDGANTYNMNSKFTKSFYSSWGYIAMNHLGTTSGNEDDVVVKMNERTAQACANAKAGSIKIYTIAFQVTDPTTIQMLTDCASDPSMAYQSGNNAALLDAFTAIGDAITSLRVSQ